MTFKPGDAVWRWGRNGRWMPAKITKAFDDGGFVYELDTLLDHGRGYIDSEHVGRFFLPRDPALNGADRPED